MLLKLAQVINQYLSDYILIILLIGVGLYYTVRTRFVQVRRFGASLRAALPDSEPICWSVSVPL